MEFLREKGVVAANLCLIAGLLFFSPLFLVGLARRRRTARLTAHRASPTRNSGLKNSKMCIRDSSLPKGCTLKTEQ